MATTTKLSPPAFKRGVDSVLTLKPLRDVVWTITHSNGKTGRVETKSDPRPPAPHGKRYQKAG